MNKHVLVIDDDFVVLKIFKLFLEKAGFRVSIAENGPEGLEIAEQTNPDIILLDVLMPEMDGYETCRRLKEDPKTKRIPVVMVTAFTDKESKLKGFEAGANDFLTKPVDRTELMARVENLLRVKEFEDFLSNHNRILAGQVLEKTKELRESYIDTIQKLTVVAEYKDPDTAAHIKRSGYFASALARRLGWPENKVEEIFYAAPMHDIGKVGIPSEILLKPAKLNPEEFALMKTHTIIGGRILHGSASDILKMAEVIALTHHERWDGTGYPAGLKAEDIPIEGRIYNICDQYDALRSRRMYKPAFSHEKTFNIITKGDGRTMPHHFDPQVLDVFKDAHKQLEEIYETHQD